MAKLSEWLKKRLELSKKQSRAAHGPPPPPFFTSPRPRPLTPAPTDDSALQPEECLLFSRLPLDIRRAIFIAAFGNRTIHIDLVFDYPLLNPRLVPPPPPGHQPNHAGIYPQKTDAGSPQPHGQKAWRWGGSVCHIERLDRSMMALRYKSGPWTDECMRGGCGWVCHWHGGPSPEACRIGALGFLLSCKQAYAEGTHVLFRTNCISLLSQPLLLDLSQLVLPQRLAAILSLEIHVKGYKTKDDKWQGRMDLSRLPTILNNISTHCQNLRSLLLSFSIPECTDMDELLASPMLPIIDAFYLSMSLRDMVLEIPELVYRRLRERAVAVDPLHPFEHEKPKTAVMHWSTPWRCLDGVDSQGRPKPEPEIQHRTIGNYPRPPLQLPTPENMEKRVPSKGYWFKDGYPYQPLPHMVCF
ncbi:hypothetical protein B0T11DRAFT_337949 [Plectosphaerella cucumerina]|jgi:hypothetical protein|uniref:DUF7730 domain-containing protein n=1 Tax=Plectosphaerella cucumerina TaxID=40658 RepID=A0A8K0X6G9_9PEZI|nr:hypothetical protein B0T11DRAFT_337949 [Plectosphaerella cucumerina]